ncbi:MAG: hypothetical protein ABI425_04345 [Patescibacteria group bacterium]
MLPKKAIQEFQQIYKEKCGIELTEDETRAHAEDFIQLFDLITRVDKKDEPSTQLLEKV